MYFNTVIHIQSVLNNVEEKYMIILQAFDHLYQKMRILQVLMNLKVHLFCFYIQDPLTFKLFQMLLKHYSDNQISLKAV